MEPSWLSEAKVNQKGENSDKLDDNNDDDAIDDEGNDNNNNNNNNDDNDNNVEPVSRQILNSGAREVAPPFNDSGISAESSGSQDCLEATTDNFRRKKKSGEVENSQLDPKSRR